MHEYHSIRNSNLKNLILHVIKIGIISGGVFLLLAAIFYSIYGIKFIE